MRERQIVIEIRKAMGKRGIVLLNNPIGMARYPDRYGNMQQVFYGVGGKGGSDLIGWMALEILGARLGVIIAMEVKRPGQNPRPEQEKFLNAVRLAGGIAGVVRSVRDAEVLIDEHVCRYRGLLQSGLENSRRHPGDEFLTRNKKKQGRD